MCPELLAIWLAHPSTGLLHADAELGPACLEQRLEELGVSSAVTLRSPDEVAPPGPAKELRDAYTVPEWAASENFVVRWGSGVELADAEGTLADLEAAWAAEIDRLAYPVPVGSEAFKLNVYVGSTGGNTPEDLGAAGYYTVDAEGYPMLVLSADTVADIEGNRATTSAHEFFHAIQHSIGSPYAFGTGEKGAWWWEATAVWINTRVHPEDPRVTDYLFGWTFFPDLPVDYFQYPDGISLEAYHAYGAFLFVDQLGSAEVVRRSWVEADDEDPLVVLDRLLEEEGDRLEGVLADLWPAIVAWDVDDGAALEAAHEDWTAEFPDQDRRVGVELEEGHFGEPAVFPGRYGATYARYRPEGSAPDVRVRFVGEPQGRKGTAAEWVTQVLVQDASGFAVYPFEEDLVVGEAGEAEAIWVVAGVLADRRVEDETFEHRVRVDEVRACGCGAGTLAAGPWLLALIAAARRSRRRVPDASTS